MQTMKSCSLFSAFCALGIGLLLLLPGPACHAQTSKKLLVFGGKDHKIFLGCLNCVQTSAKSVCNENGQYGWDLQPDSIWNPNGKFGSDISPTSPWNDLGQNPPLLKDSDGTTYGYLTTNTLNRKRTPIPWVLNILNSYVKTNDRAKARKMLCDGESSSAEADASNASPRKNSSQPSARNDPPFPFVLQSFHALTQTLHRTLHLFHGSDSADLHCSQNGNSSPRQNCPKQAATKASPAGNSSTPASAAANY